MGTLQYLKYVCENKFVWIQYIQFIKGLILRLYPFKAWEWWSYGVSKSHCCSVLTTPVGTQYIHDAMNIPSSKPRVCGEHLESVATCEIRGSQLLGCRGLTCSKELSNVSSWIPAISLSKGGLSPDLLAILCLLLTVHYSQVDNKQCDMSLSTARSATVLANR